MLVNYHIDGTLITMFTVSSFLPSYTRIVASFVRFIQLHLFITVISLPFLIASGLPLSLMSWLGNLVFAPFLMLFLLLSCLIFFFELCSLPNGGIIICLEWLTTLWTWCISYGSASWLVTCAKPSLWLLFFIPLGGLVILHLKKFSSARMRIMGFLVLLIAVITFLKYYPASTLVIKQLPCNNGTVTLIKDAGKVIVIDPGVIGQRVANNWVEYTLLKELAQSFGTTTIDYFIVAQPGILTFEYAAQLCRLAEVKHLALVVWQGESDKRLLQKYGSMRYQLENKGGTLIRINQKKMSFKYGDGELAIEPMDSLIQYKEITFPALHITISHRDLLENLELYSSKYVLQHCSHNT